MRAQLLHLSGPCRGRTITYAVPRVTVGSDPKCTAYLPDPHVAPQHARIDWIQDGCEFHLCRGEGRVFVNGNEVEEVILENEDELEFGVDGPKARFRIYVPNGAVCKPVRRMVEDARAVGRASGNSAATRSLTRDLFTQATMKLKVGFPLAVLATVGLSWLGAWWITRPSSAERQRTANMVTKEELEALRADQRTQSERLATLARTDATVRRIHEEWSRGVCLVHGVFRLQLADGSWFTMGGSEPYDIEYTGSAFLADAEGDIVTNRHVVVPWESLDEIAPLLEGGATPHFARLTATFPGRSPVDIPQASIRLDPQGMDVAVARLPAAAIAGIPVLPIAKEDRRDHDHAIVVGYPTGLGALLARADTQLVDRLRQQRASMTDAIAALAAADEVNPMINRGGISSIEDRVVTYDAPTTHGGSGGPVFAETGEVIAVNHAIQQGFTGANYGVPIRFARELLPH
ncbi:MAG: trypsin-like peptidase domain-containing protein [Planctomycetota bacterium]